MGIESVALKMIITGELLDAGHFDNKNLRRSPFFIYCSTSCGGADFCKTTPKSDKVFGCAKSFMITASWTNDATASESTPSKTGKKSTRLIIMAKH